MDFIVFKLVYKDHVSSCSLNMNEEEESLLCMLLELILVIILWKKDCSSLEGNLITMVVLWRGNVLDEIINGPQVLTRFWESSHLINPKIKHNREIVWYWDSWLFFNLSMLSSTHFSYALISNSSFYGIHCCSIQLTASLAINWMLPPPPSSPWKIDEKHIYSVYYRMT